MRLLLLTGRNLLFGISLLIGVTFLAYYLLIHAGPDVTYELIGKNSSEGEIEKIRGNLGKDKTLWEQYSLFLSNVLKLDFGASITTGQEVSQLFADKIPTSMLLVIPGFIIGNLLSIYIALIAASKNGKIFDHLVVLVSTVVMSISFVVVIIVFQLMLSSNAGLDLFPVRGWDIYDNSGNFDLLKYLYHNMVPTLSLVFISMGYNIRFYRSIFLEEINKLHVTATIAYGHTRAYVLVYGVLLNSLIPILTRILFSIPMLVVGGSFLIESYFGIPGVGLLAYQAILAGDTPIILAVVVFSSSVLVLVNISLNIFLKLADPRVKVQ